MAKATKTTNTEETKVKKPVKKVTKEVAAIPANSGFAIIETGGKQYQVAPGEVIKIEKIKSDKALKEGDEVVFDKVMLVDSGNDTVDVGTPYITGAKVIGSLVEIGRNKKVVVIKYKQKSRYQKKNGHRQPFFKVKISKIS